MARPHELAVRGPLSAASKRIETMQRAGLSDRRISELLKKAVATIEAGLEAEEQVYDKLGQLVGSRPDWKARLKATQQVLDLAGVIPSRNAPAPEPKPTKDEPIPEWARPLVAKDVTPKAAERK